MVTDDRAMAAWLVGTVLLPLGARSTVVAQVPEEPAAEAVLLAGGAPLAREGAAMAVAAGTGLPVLVLMGRTVEDEEAMRRAGAVPLRWPHSPAQIQEALLQALGGDAASRRREPPGAPHIRRSR